MVRRFNSAIGAALLCASFTGATAAHATNYNVIVFGDFSGQNSDVEGAVAAGGNITIGGYSVGANLTSSDNSSNTLVAGKSVTATSGTLAHGNVVAGTTANITPNVFNLSGGSVTTGTQVIDFAATEAAYKAYSTTLAGYTANGSVAVQPWGEMTLTGTSSGLNVFDVSSTAALSSLYINIPTGATALINWTGDPAAFSNFSMFDGSTSASNILFNFTNA